MPRISISRRRQRYQSPGPRLTFSLPNFQRPWPRATAAIITVLAIAAASHALSQPPQPRQRTVETYLVSIVETPAPRPQTEPPPPPPEPRLVPRIAQVKAPPRTHKTASHETEQPPKEVFGVDPNSVDDQGGGIVAPIGNTLMKEPEKVFTPPEEVHEIYNPPEVDAPPKYRRIIKPQYPDQARENGVEGVVKIALVVDERGRPQQVKVIEGIGSGCDEAALRAVEKYTFTPGTIAGNPVKVRVIIPVRFNLD